ncbi:universal stress protein [Clostridium cylindrosporum]|uniref:UspA domain-containing protein n=1 Tax=Clostridium cylindrosporum DSM 605 TaxID=1121307 RepID=A0A0J8DCA7_CLOCY|nr:universal stress protein [Clostridium cylindrosporum]KMT21888.1 hypothetical protein CLCY_3c01590 [Clostridium cylindrosporum DSM 605]
MKIKNILIPLDDSTRTLESINSVKSLFGDKEVVIYVLHIIDDYKFALSEFGNLDEEKVLSMNILNKAEEMLPSYNVNKISKLATGTSIAKDIVDVIDENNIDAVIMTKTGKGFYHKFILGSVTSRLLKISPVPVTIIP